ncbi:MAG: chemotaxis protein CheW [Magnetospirillum sp.]|nr:chemotaxis protein CheW [Magnetospirillum sp.]
MSQKEVAHEVLTLEMQGEIFAIDANRVREILDLVPVTEVPNSQPFVNGLVNVRGKVVPLADLRLRFGMATPPPTIDTRIVVIDAEVSGEATAVGILADRVYEVTEIMPAAIEETPRIGLKWHQEYIAGIGKRGSDFIIILDMEQVLAGAPAATH